MGVLFNNIPGNVRVPLFYAEFNPAGTPLQQNARLLLVGQMLKGTTTFAAKGGNTGNGTFALDGTSPRLPGAKAGVYKVICTTAASDGGTFTVTGPDGTVLGTYVVGAAAFANKIKFTISDGANDFAVGDEFDVTVTPYGTATPAYPVLATDAAIGLQAGLGSMLERMYWAARRNAPLQEIWILPLADDDAGTAATGSIVVAGLPITQAGAASVYIAGQRVRVPVLTSDTSNSLAAALTAAINAASPRLPVVAAVSGATITLTALHKGTLGNDIRVDLGLPTAEGFLGSQLLTITAMSGGATDPDLSTAFGNLGNDEYDWIAAPYALAGALGDASDLLNDVSGRWSWSKQIYGHYVGVHTGTVSDLTTLGTSRNDQHASVFPARKFRSPPWEVAGALGGQVAAHLQSPGSSAELSRPLRTLELVGIIGPLSPADQFTIAEQQTLLYDGISTYYMTPDGKVRISRLITMYRVNASNDADATYLDINTMAQSMFGIRALRQKVTNAHGRKALADANPGRNPGIVTADDVRITLVHGYEDLVALGVFENAELFARDIVVERDPTDPNRLNASLPLDHVNQLQVLAASAVNYMQRAEPRDSLAA